MGSLATVDQQLHPALSSALEDLQLYPASTIPSPPEVPKRASVALILRVQPNPAHLPTGNESTPTSILEFFALPWVQHGEVETLFIKRASRTGDRWTAHVAFPGGKRDPGDSDDLAAAVRETLEEVGLDLTQEEGLACGHLPDRVVTTSWGTVPLMVLCPFVFLLTAPTPPALHLQPTEVASAHWVPLRLLLDPRFRTVEICDVSDRLAWRVSGVLGSVVRYAIRLSLGKMEYSAVRLWPSQSAYSTFGKDFLAPAMEGKWESPLVLWGLTLGIIEDFVDMLPPVGEALALWRWPTFTALDVRFVVGAMSRGLRARNMERAKRHSVAAAAMLVDDVAGRRDAARMEDSIVDLRSLDDSVRDVRESGVLVPAASESGSEGGSKTLEKLGEERERISCVNTLLEGYFDVLRKAIWITLAGRAVVGIAVIGTLAWKFTRR